MMQRYTDVLLAASNGGVRLELAPGSEAVPMKVRLLFLEAFMGVADHPNSWPRTAAPLNGKGLTPEIAAEMVRRQPPISTDSIVHSAVMAAILSG